jgi:hypothetical protein
MLAASESAQRDEPASARTLGFLRLHFIRLTLRVRQVDDAARFRIAAAGAKGLPEPERLMIEGALAAGAETPPLASRPFAASPNWCRAMHAVTTCSRRRPSRGQHR